MNKMKSRAFGKDCYFLGVQDGAHIWLEAAKWDCDWYWGFGYVEEYTSRDPSMARDIRSHSHFDQFLFKGEGGKCRLSEYGVETPLTDSEQWTLAELMRSFYKLKDAAEVFHMGGAHISSNPAKEVLKNAEMEKHINEVMLPAVFDEIYNLLTPLSRNTEEAS